MTRQFKTVDYAASLQQTVTIAECLPPDHLARFIVSVIAMLDLSAIYVQYAPRGGEPYAPEMLLGLLLYGYVSGVFSSRQIERATYESIPFRYIAGGWHPDHDTIANFRKTFLAQIADLFVQVLLVAKEADVLQLGRISLDGSKVHADASKSKAVSYKRLLELEHLLQQEVAELLALSAQAEVGDLPVNMDVHEELVLRRTRLANLAQAKKVLELRAEERYQAEKAEYEAQIQAREARAREENRKPRGRKPQLPQQQGPRDKDQYNFTDPDSRIMKNSTDKGFDQHYNVQVAVEQDSFLIVAHSLSNHPTDRNEALPTLDAMAPTLGTPEAAALDTGYFNAPNIAGMEQRGIDPYIATGRESHYKSWRMRFAELPAPPPPEARPIVKMAYKLRTEIGQEIYKLRKSTVEPVIGIIKEIMGFRQFSLRGLAAAAGEWCLVCLAFNLKRLHVLLAGQI
ncbi:MAG: transposase [Diaphorobacter sp.]|nr:transposase [Diaphorobacter sp.]